jgi:hypothetical protein
MRGGDGTEVEVCPKSVVEDKCKECCCSCAVIMSLVANVLAHYHGSQFWKLATSYLYAEFMMISLNHDEYNTISRS